MQSKLPPNKNYGLLFIFSMSLSFYPLTTILLNLNFYLLEIVLQVCETTSSGQKFKFKIASKIRWHMVTEWYGFNQIILVALSLCIKACDYRQYLICYTNGASTIT